MAAKADVSLRKDSEKLPPVEVLPVPAILKDRNNYVTAGLYGIQLPVSVYDGDVLWLEFIQRSEQTGKPEIISLNNNRLAGISPHVPPVFSNKQVMLKIPGATSRLINKSVLWVRSRAGYRYQHLSTMRDSNQAYFDDSGNLLVEMDSLLPENLATYTVELRQGMREVFTAPLQFAVVLGLRITPPDLQKIYTPVSLPKCLVQGVLPTSFVDTGNYQIHRSDGAYEVTWDDRPQPCLLRLQKGEEFVTLRWDVDRVSAWLSPCPMQDMLTIDEFQNLTLNVVGPPSSSDIVSWKLSDGTVRPLKLDRRDGRYSNPIRRDPLYDKVRDALLEGDVRITATAGDDEWGLCTVRGTNFLRITLIEYVVEEDGKYLRIGCDLSSPVAGEFEVICQDLFTSEEVFHDIYAELQPHQSIRCNLADGYYRLVILKDEEPLLLKGKTRSQKTIWFSVGAIPEADLERLEQLAELSQLTGPLKPEQLDDFATWINLKASTGRATTPQEHLRLLTARANAQPLGGIEDRLLGVTNRVRAKRDSDLLPAWAVLNRPLVLEIALVTHHMVTIYPEVTARKGQRGIGHTFLPSTINDELLQLYVKWDIVDRDQVSVFIGLPTVPVDSFESFDTLDAAYLRVCTECGEFIVYERTKLPDSIIEEHRHGGDQHQIVMIEYDLDLRAYLDYSRSGETLEFRTTPGETIDRTYAAALFSGQAEYTDHGPDDRHSPWFYRYAMSEWIEKYFYDDAVKQAIKACMLPEWRALFAGLRQEFNANDDFGPLRAARELLDTLYDLQGQTNIRALDVDLHTLLFAILVRLLAHHRTMGLTVMGHANIQWEDLVQFLALAEAGWPSLLEWAFEWAELFFVHAV